MIFETPALAAQIMAGFDKPWFIAGGWAIDLYLGHITRPHDDIEIAIFRNDQLSLQSYLSDWDLRKVVPGKTLYRETWSVGENLTLPIHEIHASHKGDEFPEFEILLNESTENQWIFRRNQAISWPLSRTCIISEEGIPYLCPEIVLLYKAKQPTPKDEADFFRTYGRLADAPRRWLSESIHQCYPCHPWLALLSNE